LRDVTSPDNSRDVDPRFKGRLDHPSFDGMSLKMSSDFPLLACCDPHREKGLSLGTGSTPFFSYPTAFIARGFVFFFLHVLSFVLKDIENIEEFVKTEVSDPPVGFPSFFFS